MYFDEKPALKVKHFLERFCVMSKHPWAMEPLKLMPWQWEDIIKPLYGWRRADGTRRFSRLLCYIPKKQGKSTLLSGLCLYHLLEYPGSEVYCLASDVAQANIVAEESANMVELSPLLKKRLWVRRNIKTIEDKKAHSKYRVLSSEPQGKAGFSANLICYDELCEWGSHARMVWDQLQNAGAARENALQVVISTAQWDKTHIGYEQYQVAKGLISGVIEDTSTLAVVYEVEEGADWRDPEQWWKANPSAGFTVPKQYYYDEFKRIENNPIDEARFRTLLCNQWVGHSQQWIASDVWAACKEDFTEESLHDQTTYVGIDMARRHDLACYVLCIPKGNSYYFLPRFFMPRDNAYKKVKKDKVPYDRWAEKYITLTPGDTIDPAAIRASLAEDAQNFDIVECRFDPYGMEESRQIIEEEIGLFMVEVKQSYNELSSPTAQFERLTIDGRVKHNGHPIATWCLGNTTIKADSQDRIMVDKQHSTGRIDFSSAAVMALSGALASEGAWDLPCVLL